jgi:hypothetical protein
MYHQETCCFLVTFVIEKTCKHKMMNEKKKTRKARRTKADIEKAINEAARSTIMEKGFAQTTILDIIKKAKIEPATFYKRYKKEEALFLFQTGKFKQALRTWKIFTTTSHINLITGLATLSNTPRPERARKNVTPTY